MIVQLVTRYIAKMHSLTVSIFYVYDKADSLRTGSRTPQAKITTVAVIAI